MKVLNLRCANGHGFEGWFGSDDDYLAQHGRGLVACPLCADHMVTRLPTAPRLNLSGAREATAPAVPESAAPAVAAAATLPDLQVAWLKTVREVMARTEDVGEDFAEEARRIHYGDAERRGIRGVATHEEREALADEGIEAVSLPLPVGWDGSTH